MDPLQWMGAVRMKVDKYHNNPQVIHTTPVHQLTFYEVKSYMFERNISIKTLLTSNRCFWLKYKSSIHTIRSPVKNLSCLNQERNMHRSPLFTSENGPKLVQTNI